LRILIDSDTDAALAENFQNGAIMFFISLLFSSFYLVNIGYDFAGAFIGGIIIGFIVGGLTGSLPFLIKWARRRWG
jgi:hypothetical protein